MKSRRLPILLLGALNAIVWSLVAIEHQALTQLAEGTYVEPTKLTEYEVRDPFEEPIQASAELKLR